MSGEGCPLLGLPLLLLVRSLLLVGVILSVLFSRAKNLLNSAISFVLLVSRARVLVPPA